jgi:sterol desaturase/sphingolipid hydroxylase (fatty acid hydroxylase superfamily)
MLPISGLLIVLAGTFWPHAHGELPGSDEAYTYMGILSVLLVHYVHDAVLFTDHEAIIEPDLGTAAAPAPGVG